MMHSIGRGIKFIKYAEKLQNAIHLIGGEYRVCLEANLNPTYKLTTKDVDLFEAFKLCDLLRIQYFDVCKKCQKCKDCIGPVAVEQYYYRTRQQTHPEIFTFDTTPEIFPSILRSYVLLCSEVTFGYKDYFYNQENIMKVLSYDLTDDNGVKPTLRKIKLFTDKEFTENIHPNNLKFIEFVYEN